MAWAPGCIGSLIENAFGGLVNFWSILRFTLLSYKMGILLIRINENSTIVYIKTAL